MSYRSFVSLIACCRTTRDALWGSVSQSHARAWLLQLVDEGVAPTAVRTLALLLQPSNCLIDSLIRTHEIELEWACALIRAGFSPTYQQIRTAALQGTPGVYVWALAFRESQVATPFPPRLGLNPVTVKAVVAGSTRGQRLAWGSGQQHIAPGVPRRGLMALQLHSACSISSHCRL